MRKRKGGFAKRYRLRVSTSALLRATLCLLVMVVAVIPAFAQTNYVEKYPIFGTHEGPYSYAEIDKKDYSGITLNAITLAPPVMGGPTILHAKQFEELTGAKINVVAVPLSQLYAKVMTPFLTGIGAYDAIIFPPNWSGDIMGGGYLEPLPEKMLKSAQWGEVIQVYRYLQTWGGKIYGVPIDGDKHFLAYRRDAIDAPKYQSKFKEKYGYDLRPPQTWDEYRDVAEFFNDWDWDGDGVKEYGASEMTQRDAQLFWQFIVRAAPYAQHPDVKGGFFFDVETMTPLINTPGFVQALEDMIEIQKFYPPGGKNFSLSDVIFSFGGGQTALHANWDDGFIQAMEKDSPIRNKVNATMAPGAKKAWNRKTNKWDEFPDINRAPFLAWGGWITGVPKTSENKEAAFDFLGFLSNNANQQKDLTVGRYGVNPYRTNDFDPAFWIEKAGFDPEVAKGYTDALRNTLNHPNRVFDLRIPGNQLYVNALATAVSEALAGNLEPQKALDKAAKEWDKITHRVGFDQQKTAYQEIVNLEGK